MSNRRHPVAWNRRRKLEIKRICATLYAQAIPLIGTRNCLAATICRIPNARQGPQRVTSLVAIVRIRSSCNPVIGAKVDIVGDGHVACNRPRPQIKGESKPCFRRRKVGISLRDRVPASLGGIGDANAINRRMTRWTRLDDLA